MEWLSLGQSSLETDHPSKGVASPTTVSKDEAAFPVLEHPLRQWAPPLSPALASKHLYQPLREASLTPPAHCVSPLLRAAWGLSSLLASSHSKSCLLGAHLTAKKTAAQGAMGTWPSEESGEPGWEVGSPASRPGRAPHVSPGSSSVSHMPWLAFPLCCLLASCLEPLSTHLSGFITVIS